MFKSYVPTDEFSSIGKLFPVVKERRKNPFLFSDLLRVGKLVKGKFYNRELKMDFATGGIAAGGFYGAGMAGSRFDRKLRFESQVHLLNIITRK